MQLPGAQAKTLGHLGLVASTLLDLDVMSKIDVQLGQVPCSSVSYGVRVAAMVLNGLGFCNKALSMTPRFFHDKPLSLLFGQPISAESLNDDCLGRCLDKLASYGVTKWYSELAFKVLNSAGLLTGSAHLDSSTLSLYGSYEAYESNELLRPCHGHSKDHRPDLKQVTLQCVALGKAALPIWMEALDGNSSDKASFPKTVKQLDAFYQALASAPSLRFVADSALYGPELDALNVTWLTRVPEIYKEAKQLCNQVQVEWQAHPDERYKIFPYQPIGKAQRWLLVRSTAAYQREKATCLRKHERRFEPLQKALWHCSCQRFGCEKDATAAVEKIILSKAFYHHVDYQIIAIPKFETKGRPPKEAVPECYEYQVEILGIATNLNAIQQHCNTLGRFILATNELNETTCSNEQMLSDYKDQNSIEGGFKFIKNDAVGLDEIYLKNPERIAALMAIMTLCLLIYGITQQRIRDALKQNNEYLPDRKGKPTQTPTLLWIFTLFSSITVLAYLKNESEQQIILNLQPIHEKIICLLGEWAKKIYHVPKDRQYNHIELNQKTWLKWCGI